MIHTADLPSSPTAATPPGILQAAPPVIRRPCERGINDQTPGLIVCPDLESDDPLCHLVAARHLRTVDMNRWSFRRSCLIADRRSLVEGSQRIGHMQRTCSAFAN